MAAIDYSKFQRSLKRLEEQYKNYLHLDSSVPQWFQEAVAESTIKRFEICYDSLWKVLRRYLFEELGIPDPPSSPKPLFRIAFENKLLSSSVIDWLHYADSRNATSHDYDGDKAQNCLNIVDDFINDAIRLYQTMTDESWE